MRGSGEIQRDDARVFLTFNAYARRAEDGTTPLLSRDFSGGVGVGTVHAKEECR